MKQTTRVQDLENLKQEAIARIKAVLDLHQHYTLYPLDDNYEHLEDIAKNAPMYYERIRRLSFCVYGLYKNKDGIIALEMYSFNNQERNIVTTDYLEVGTDDRMILAIADRIDELEQTGIHVPPVLQPDDYPKIVASTNKTVRERDTYNPEGI